MHHKRNTRGFTIVELIVVIIVIGILATIAIVTYQNVQKQARDTSMRNGARKIADSIEIWSANHPGVKPKVGANSEGPAHADGCHATSAGTGGGWVAANYPSSGYYCTWGDVLIASKYLPADFFEKLPPNVQTIWPQVPKLNFLLYECDGDSYLLHTLENPTSQDMANMSMFTSGVCSGESWVHSDAGMRAAIKLKMSY